jgi:hypothetical protein
MRRISSLPTAEFCPKVDKIGLDVESTQSARSTIFHAYCDTGVWPAEIVNLPEADREEIQKWKVPMPFIYKVGDVTHALQYKNAFREWRVAVDKDFQAVEVPIDVPQNDIERLYPQVMICGHLDMAWVLPEYDLIIVCDIKSSIFAVKEGHRSLQLQGYGLAACAATGIGRYLTAIWDASDGQYYVAKEAIEADGFEAADIRSRIRIASEDRDGAFRTGTHCSGCWKRSQCPAHLVNVPEGEFKAVLSGQATEADIRRALVAKKQIEDLKGAVDNAIKSWVEQHGPVRSEDGRKHYRCELRKGKPKLDEKKVANALGVETLEDYKTRGGEYPVFDWRNVE